MINNGLDGVVKFIRINKLIWWDIRKSNGDNQYIFKSEKDVDIEPEITRMREALENVESGTLIVTGGTTNATTGRFTETFAHNMGKGYSPAPVASVSGVPIGYVPEEKVSDIVTQKLNEYKREVEFEELKKQCAFYKAESEKGINKFLGALEPIMPMIGQVVMSKLNPGTQVAVAGLQNNYQQQKPIEMDEERDVSAQAEAYLNMWAEADPDCLLLLQKIAEMAQTRNNPGSMYNMAKQMLLNQ